MALLCYNYAMFEHSGGGRRLRAKGIKLVGTNLPFLMRVFGVVFMQPKKKTRLTMRVLGGLPPAYFMSLD
jgi:hypothetical protein